MFVNTVFAALNRVSPIIMQTPWIGAIGNCAEELYYGLLRARREGKKVFFLLPYDLFWKFKFSKRGKGINRKLLKVDSRYRFIGYDHPLSIVAAWAISILYYFFRVIAIIKSSLFGKGTKENYLIPNIGESDLWRPGDISFFSRKKVEEYRWMDQMVEYLPVHLQEKEAKKGEKLRLEMGLSKDDWHVCLHVREGGYYGYKEGSFKMVRNASIRNYSKAIERITKAGGWVIRMGDISMTQLPAMERVIDYPHTPFKSPLMDIYLIQECRFYVGSQSGIWSVASLFQKPVLTPNMGEWLDSFPERKGDLGIIKHIYSRSKGRFLSLKESLDEFSKYQYSTDWSDEYELHENTEDEIYDLIEEYLEPKKIREYTPLQKEWNRRRIIEGYRLLENRQLIADKEKDLMIKYHQAARIEGCAGALGKKFLEQNWEHSTMNGPK